MMFLAPGITEKALATVHATASGVCGPPGVNRPCLFIWSAQQLDKGKWVSEPTKEGTFVTWSTVGNPQPGDEEGSVTYKIGPDEGIAVLHFDNPVVGSNKCHVGGSVDGTCTAGSGQNAEFTYKVEKVTYK